MLKILKKAVLWRWDRWDRYRPVIKFLKNKYRNTRINILEVGCGEYSMNLYDGYKVEGLDIRPPENFDFIDKFIKESILDTTLSPKTYDTVVSVDMLEHIKPEDREKAIKNMIMLARKEVILVYPEGKTAEEVDRKLYSQYRKKVARYHLWLDEHQKYGIPQDEQIKIYLSKIKRIKNISFHKISNATKVLTYGCFMMSSNYKWFLFKNKLVVLFDMFFGKLLNEQKYYRTLLVITLDD